MLAKTVPIAEGDSVRGPSLFRSRSLYINLVTAFVVLLAASTWSVVYFNYRNNARVLLRLADDLMARVSEAVMERTRAYLQPEVVLVEMSGKLAQHGAIPIGPTDQFERYAIEALRAYPQVSQFYFGDEQGNYLMTTRQPNGTVATKIIDRRARRHSILWKYRDASLRVVRTETLIDDPYDPRTRPWYIAAKQAGGLFWTDVYVFYTGHQPGITCAFPFIAGNGKLRGVFAADIPLGDISRFLQTLTIGKSGVALVADKHGEVVAYPDLSRMVTHDGEARRPARLEELGAPSVVAAFAEHRRTGAAKGFVEVVSERYIYSIRDLSGVLHRDWQIAVVVPENDLVGALKDANRVAVWIGLAVLVTSIASAALLARSISRPIKRLAEQADKVREFHLLGPLNIRSSIKEIQLMSRSFAAMETGLLAFRKYVPAELVRQLIHTGEEARLGGQRRALTLFFSDIEGFTALSGQIKPEELMVHLSEYLDEVVKVILAQHGTIDKYIGDSVMAFWGAPLPDAQQAQHACEAALRCHERIAELNEHWRRAGRPPMPTRIGIHSGETIVGNMGSSERLNYTAMGDSVNLASRLEGANKYFGTRVLVSQATRDIAAGDFLFRPIAFVVVQGKSEAIAVYELVGRKSDPPDTASEAFCRQFAEGVDAYRRRAWSDALAIFEKLRALRPQDVPTQRYLERCAAYANQPPAADWLPVEHLVTK